MSQFKEYSALTNSFSATENVSPKVSLSGSGTFSAEREEGFDRFTDSRSGNGSMSWRPIDGIEMSTSFSRTVSLEERYGEQTRDDQSESATGSIRFATGNWLNTNLSVGLQNVDYIRVSGDTISAGNNDGSLYRVGSTINKTFFGGINTSLGFTENRTYGNETENESNGLNVRTSYYFPDSFRGGSLSAQVAASRNNILYIDSLTEKVGENWSHSESAELPEIIPGVFMEFSTGWNEENDHYESTEPDSILDNPRNNDRQGRSLSSMLIWEASDNMDLDFSFTRSIDEKANSALDYNTGEYYQLNEKSDDKLLDIVLTYNPGDSRVTFQRLVELYSYDTDIENEDTLSFVNDYDRDEYRQLLAISATIPLSSRFTLTSSMTGQERTIYYLMSSQSANSRTTSTYAFYPGYRYDLGRNWKISQSVKITATYTEYIFSEAAGVSDRLSRRLDESFALVRTSSDSTTLGISQSFTFNDQGTLENNIYLRSEESLNSSIGVDVGFHVSSRVGVTPTYNYQYLSRNRMAYGLKTVDNIHHVGLRSAIDTMGGTMNANITRSFYSDPTKDSYWKASVGFNLRM